LEEAIAQEEGEEEAVDDDVVDTETQFLKYFPNMTSFYKFNGDLMKRNRSRRDFNIA
jgi:hypothetical protein